MFLKFDPLLGLKVSVAVLNRWSSPYVEKINILYMRRDNTLHFPKTFNHCFSKLNHSCVVTSFPS